jgi:hypothetical protein
MFLCFCTMYSGPPIIIPFGFTTDVYNLTWSTYGSNIFADYCCHKKMPFNFMCCLFLNVIPIYLVIFLILRFL